MAIYPSKQGLPSVEGKKESVDQPRKGGLAAHGIILYKLELIERKQLDFVKLYNFRQILSYFFV